MKSFIWPTVIVLVFVAAAIALARIGRSRESDLESIRALARARQISISQIQRTTSHWRYWLRGNLLLSNLSRIYRLDATGSDGKTLEIHLGFDPLRAELGPIILEERIHDLNEHGR